ncbi:hypothetical protein QBC42DRAFT_345890 [Cladorrhinum samala]|uniref:Zn(2)-C6 fungal-type domain-containing protein n=1 Tax=Cladorrhinum samala TaxID=585594 RepID=A0AAV9HQR8_9PEZI|nr:hypothetical protein QBC42DRAFT_345890 [Cladorrhinum samala]
MATQQRRIGSRSCDACRIRKVKCTEAAPCQRCVAAGVDCTFNKIQAQRGPRGLRARTLQQIQKATYQQQQPPPPLHPAGTTPGIPTESLIVRLCIYRLRLFPVWPIVAVEEVIGALNAEAKHDGTYVLAAALAAATMAQLKLDRFKDADINDSITAADFHNECLRRRGGLSSASASLDRIRTSFFLHIYHENQIPGGTESLLYLREAITLAQIMGLHRPSSYLALDRTEDRLRRRILWLLFATERGVAMLHRLPVVLRSAGELPPLDIEGSDDRPDVLPAFKRLVNLFWIFDQSRAFDILQQDGLDSGADGSDPLDLPASHEVLGALQRRLQEVSVAEVGDEGSDVQKADICTTRQWMQILIWRAMLRSGYWGGGSTAAAIAGPVQIAQQLLEDISRLPRTALEAHGPGLEFKIYEIASAVADSLNFSDPHPSDILLRLQRFLATSRGGNTNLAALLAARIAQSQLPPEVQQPELSYGAEETHIVEEITDDDDNDGRASGDSLDCPPSPWQSLVAAVELEQQSLTFPDSLADMAWLLPPDSTSSTPSANKE